MEKFLFAIGEIISSGTHVCFSKAFENSSMSVTFRKVIGLTVYRKAFDISSEMSSHFILSEYILKVHNDFINDVTKTEYEIQVNKTNNRS